jgi:Meiotically up-regulated gene 113
MLTAIPMKYLNYIEDRFYEVYFSLTEPDILKLEKLDNGPLNNVIANINKECFGVAIYEDRNDYTVEMFYVTNVDQLEGDLIRLKLNDPDYVSILFYFCQKLVINYIELDVINTFNTFQSRLRSFLEKLGFFTTTNLELEKFEGQEVTMMSTAPKGIKNVLLFDRVDYYRKFFGDIYHIKRDEKKDYTYLMVNDDTGLIKIGRSNNPRYREKTLQSQEPTVHIIACWETPKNVEADLHKLYNHKRIRGEWFRLNMTDLKKLEQFMKHRV